MSKPRPYSFWPVDQVRGCAQPCWAIGRWGPAMIVMTDDVAIVRLVVEALNALDEQQKQEF